MCAQNTLCVKCALKTVSDHTIPIRNQNPDPVIMVWEHTVCVGHRMIRGHFRMAPQPGKSMLVNIPISQQGLSRYSPHPCLVGHITYRLSSIPVTVNTGGCHKWKALITNAARYVPPVTEHVPLHSTSLC